MSLKNLSLYRSVIEDAVCTYPNYVAHTVKQLPDNRFNFTISVKGHQHPALLNVINLTDGNTTLNTEVGRNKQLSSSIAEHISLCCSLPNIESKRLYIKEMSDQDFRIFLDFISAEKKLKISEPKQIQNGQSYLLSWTEGGHVHITRYNTKSFSVQGNSNHVKEKLIEILTQVLPFKEVIAVQMESLEVNVTSDQVVAETEAIMPIAFKELGDTLVAIISPSIALRTVNIDLADYSAFTFPLLRGIEGVLRMILPRFGIIVGENVGAVFNKLNNGTFELQLAHRTKIPDVGIIRLIDELYNMYYIERHTTFHTNINVQTSRIIEDKDEALKIIDEGISNIEDLYIKVSNANLQAI